MLVLCKYRLDTSFVTEEGAMMINVTSSEFIENEFLRNLYKHVRNTRFLARFKLEWYLPECGRPRFKEY